MLVPFLNGILDVAAYLDFGEVRLIPHTPGLFTTSCLPRKFEANADCPLWTSFLAEATEGDAETVDLLGEWTGYNLIPDNRFQALLFAIGPPRSGKGTYLSILEDMIGPLNVASFTLRDLAGEFGLQTLPGKLAAVCPDAHVPKDRDVVNALEMIKTVSGEGRVRINPKGQAAFDAKLFCRFSIAMNQLPKLSDSSAAMRKRVLVARFPRGREQHEIDPKLTDKLRSELRGITLWALAGLRRLMARGRFAQPKSSQYVLDTFTRWSSPILGFIEDCCTISPGARTLTSRVQMAWQMWCAETGHLSGSDVNLGVQLLAASLTIEKKRLRCDEAKDDPDNRKYHYLNITLQPQMLARVIRAEKETRQFDRK